MTTNLRSRLMEDSHRLPSQEPTAKHARSEAGNAGADPADSTISTSNQRVVTANAGVMLGGLVPRTTT